MDPGLLILGSLAVGATALLPQFSKSRKEGFEVIPTPGYPQTVERGQEIFNRLTLASDPRREALRLDSLPDGVQQSYKEAVDTALGQTDVSFLGRRSSLQQTETQNPVYLPDDEDISLRAAFCDRAAINNNTFKNAQFAKDCGICYSKGITHYDQKFQGPRGMFINPRQKQALLEERASSGSAFSKGKPTYGLCDGATATIGHDYTFALDEKEQDPIAQRARCKHERVLDGTCATCLRDSSFTYVPKEGRELDPITFWIWGNNANLDATLGGQRIDFNPPRNVFTVRLSPSSPRRISAVLNEGSFMNFAISGAGWDSRSKRLVVAEFWGYADFPNATGGVESIPLDRILMKDEITGNRPRYARTLADYNGFLMRKLLKPSNQQSAIFSAQVPFLSINNAPFEGIDCKSSLLQSLPESVERFGGDPCYKPSTQGPGSWTDACLKDRVQMFGCTDGGSLYRDPSSLKGMTMVQMQKTIQEIASKQYSENSSSLKCNGRNISTPCDPYVGVDPEDAPDLSPQCIEYLYYNRGAEKPHIGRTYNGPVNTYYSLDRSGKKIMCLPGAKMDPMGPNGNWSINLFRNYYRWGWGGRQGLEAVKGVMNYEYNRALQFNLPVTTAGRKDAIEYCFFNLANLEGTVIPDRSIPKARYCRVRYPPGRVEAIQIAQIACYDNRNVNVAQGKPTYATSTWQNGADGAVASKAVDGTLSPRKHPNEFHSGVKANDFWQVDFGRTFPIKRIVYYNRQDCCSNRASGMLIELYNEQGRVVWSTTLNSDMIQTFNTSSKIFNV